MHGFKSAVLAIFKFWVCQIQDLVQLKQKTEIASKSTLKISKILFNLGSYKYLASLFRKQNQKVPFFDIHICKKTVWSSCLDFKLVFYAASLIKEIRENTLSILQQPEQHQQIKHVQTSSNKRIRSYSFTPASIQHSLSVCDEDQVKKEVKF